jgi:hypothetical protein
MAIANQARGEECFANELNLHGIRAGYAARFKS